MQAIQSIDAVSGLFSTAATGEVAATESRPVTTFSEVLKGLVTESDESQKAADQTLGAFERGEVKDVHEVTVAMSKADLDFRMMLEVRSRLLESYQTLMRSQI